MSDVLKKVIRPVSAHITFNPEAYIATPNHCVTYQFSSGQSTTSSVPIEDLRALEFSLRQVLDNVIKPEIHRKVKRQQIENHKKSDNFTCTGIIGTESKDFNYTGVIGYPNI